MWTCCGPERMMHLISAIFPSTLVFPHRLPKGIPSVWAACHFCQQPILVSLFFFFPLKGSICGQISPPPEPLVFFKNRQSHQRGRSVSATDSRQIRGLQGGASLKVCLFFAAGKQRCCSVFGLLHCTVSSTKGHLSLFFFFFSLKKEKNSLLNVCHCFHSEAAGRTQYVGQTNSVRLPRPSTPELKWQQKVEALLCTASESSRRGEPGGVPPTSTSTCSLKHPPVRRREI